MNEHQASGALQEAIDEFVRRVSLLTRDDSLRVIWAYCQHLQLPEFDLPKWIEVAPEFHELEVKQLWISEWELETLARQVLIHARDKGLSKRSLRRWANMSTLVNCLKRLENEIYGRYGSQDNVLFEVGRMAHRQFSWQGNRPNSTSLIRYYTIFNTNEINEIARDRLGLSVEEIYVCATAFLGSLRSAPAVRCPVRSEIEKVPAETFARFTNWCAIDATKIRQILKHETSLNDTFAYSYNSLRRWPLISTKDDAGHLVLCPLPTLLFWRYTSGLYYDLIGDDRFSNALGTSFQSYVGQLLNCASRTRRLRVLPEQEYGSRKARKRSVDWIVYDGRDAVFAECKSKRLGWGAKAALTDISALTDDIETLGASVVQVYKTLRDYIDGHYPHFPYREKCGVYPMVVTLENWRLFGPRIMEILKTAVCRQLREAGLPEDWATKFPYSVVAADEAETIFQIMDGEGIANFLDGKVLNAEFAGWEWSGYSRHRYPQFQCQPLFEKEYQAFFSNVRDTDGVSA